MRAAELDDDEILIEHIKKDIRRFRDMEKEHGRDVYPDTGYGL